MCTITLTDGTTIEANLNMNTWESEKEIDDTIFENNTDNISYLTEDKEVVELGDCKYMNGGKHGDLYYFFLIPLTDEEKHFAEIEDVLNYLLMEGE